MVNTQLFQTIKGALLPAATARNESQAPAYEFTPRHQLAQLAATGCLSKTFYANAEDQLEQIGNLVLSLETSYVAITVVTRSGAWEFSFIAQGWVPQAGEFDATCFLLPGVPWPALVLVEGNICYPRETPKRVG